MPQWRAGRERQDGRDASRKHQAQARSRFGVCIGGSSGGMAARRLRSKGRPACPGDDRSTSDSVNQLRPQTALPMQDHSRVQHPLGPSARAVALIQPAFVYPELSAEPEFDPFGLHAQAAPARWTRNFAAIEIAFGLCQALLKGRTGIERLRLFRRPGTQLAAARARGEVGVGFDIADGVHHAFDAHLHAIAHARPVEQQRRMRVGLEFAALAAIEVGIENEAPHVVGLEKQGPRRGPGVERGRGDDHGGAVGFAGDRGFVEQPVEGGEGFSVEVGSDHRVIVGGLLNAILILIKPPSRPVRIVAPPPKRVINVRKGLICSAASLILATVAVPAFAQSAGTWTMGVGVHQVDPKSDSGVDGLDVDSNVRPTITGEYFVADNLGLEVLAALPFEHDIDVGGAKVGSTKQLPPTVSLQYHFNSAGTVSPFIGAGLNYTIFFSEDTEVQTRMRGEKAAIRVDVRWIDIDSDASVNGAKLG